MSEGVLAVLEADGWTWKCHVCMETFPSNVVVAYAADDNGWACSHAAPALDQSAQQGASDE